MTNTNPEARDDACLGCRFWVRKTDHDGNCHRYPSTESKRYSHWCGEFSKSKDARALPKTVYPVVSSGSW